jgi:hypothetical protein
LHLKNLSENLTVLEYRAEVVKLLWWLGVRSVYMRIGKKCRLFKELENWLCEILWAGHQQQ